MDKVVSFTSLVVACAALIIAVMAWRRPFPPDPTAIPRFGRAGAPENLNESDRVNAFFSFLREHAGRKVLLYTVISRQADDPNEMTKTGFAGLKDSGGLTDTIYVPERSDNKNAIGIYYQQGSWRLRGYFANAGVVQIAQGLREHKLTPLSDDEAVT